MRPADLVGDGRGGADALDLPGRLDRPLPHDGPADVLERRLREELLEAAEVRHRQHVELEAETRGQAAVALGDAAPAGPWARRARRSRRAPTPAGRARRPCARTASPHPRPARTGTTAGPCRRSSTGRRSAAAGRRRGRGPRGRPAGRRCGRPAPPPARAPRPAAPAAARPRSRQATKVTHLPGGDEEEEEDDAGDGEPVGHAERPARVLAAGQHHGGHRRRPAEQPADVRLPRHAGRRRT